MSLPGDGDDAIRNVLAAYNHAIDAGDQAGFADCFTDDGAYRIEHLGFEARGRQALMQLVADNSEQTLGAPTRHWNSNVLIDGDAEAGTATAKVYLIVLGLGPAGPQALATGIYADRLEKRDGVWKLVERVSHLDEWVKPLGDTAQRMKDTGVT